MLELPCAAAKLIEDLDSTNGTQVNGTQIHSPTPLADGNEVALGSEILLVRMRNPSAPTVKSERRGS